jgi:hypothetical protein
LDAFAVKKEKLGDTKGHEFIKKGLILLGVEFSNLLAIPGDMKFLPYHPLHLEPTASQLINVADTCFHMFNFQADRSCAGTLP